MSAAPELCPEARLLVRLGLVLWLGAGVATVWEVLALQWPDSPFHAGVLAGPIAQLRGFAFGLGGVSLVAAWLWPVLYGAGRGRYALGLLASGIVLHLGALGYAASQGLMAVQVIDPRPDARWVVYTRGFAHALVMLAALDATVRAAVKTRGR